MKYNTSISLKRIAWLRQRLQRCEKRIIETAQWDTKYFYDGFLTSSQQNQLIALFRNRRNILNELIAFSDEEIRRLEALNASLVAASQQMCIEFKNVYQGRLVMPDMAQYDDDTCVEIRLCYHYDGKDSVLAMNEDAYYGSQFENMLEMLCAEEGNLTYQGGAWLSMQLDKLDHTSNFDMNEKWNNTINNALGMEYSSEKVPIRLCSALHDITTHHLYSVPDVLRMNNFQIKVIMEQKRDLCVTPW